MSKPTAQERRQQDRERLEAATRELLTSEGWQAWVRTRSRFHSYSFGNQILIAMQYPEATRVAGYKTWQTLGRQVRKGEKGIRILAPMTIKREQENAQGESETKTLTLFKSVSVFDVSQTDGEPLPAPPIEPLTGDSHADYLPKLEAFAATIGYSVSYENPGKGEGYCNSREKRIVVSDEQAPNGRVAILIHELAHALGIDYESHSRAHAEGIVESVAFIVSAGIGLDTSAASVGYVASWGESDDLDALKQHADTIDQIAATLEVALGEKAPVLKGVGA